ncbi:MAG TPA: hypothetical protein H9774_00555, partial [Candidatus Desulfovibrio gallistercoris]|nr:hypothetical protein [Candidatus Desulfovibrio gallistercoris]
QAPLPSPSALLLERFAFEKAKCGWHFVEGYFYKLLKNNYLSELCKVLCDPVWLICRVGGRWESLRKGALFYRK